MRTLVALLVSLMSTACTSQANPDSRASGASTNQGTTFEFADPDVQRIYTDMVDAMAPDGAWDRTRYLQFDWIFDRGDGNPLARSHKWDRYTGDYKLEMIDREGRPVIAVFNTEAPMDGRVWLDGVLQEGEAAAELLDRAHGTYINDSYWLIMPYKWADPGVVTRFLGTETDESGADWEVVELSFESVGRTPDNMYRAFVNPETHLMERWWHYRTAEAEPSPANWTEWTQMGEILLPLDRPRPDGSRIRFEDVVASAEVPEGALVAPER